MSSNGVFQHEVQSCSCHIDWKMNLQPDIGIMMCPDVNIEYH